MSNFAAELDPQESTLSAPLENIINQTALRSVEALRRQYSQAKPFRHVVIEDFLDAGFASQLLAAFPAFESGNSIGEDGRPGGKSTVERMQALGPSYRALDELVQSPDFLQFVGNITGIDGLLYDPFYLGGGTHENRQGQFLQAHIDFNYHPSERWHRRLNLIVYLNSLWDEAWGGNLELFRDPYQDAQPALRVVPRFNRCVIFETTENSWHGFDRISLPAEHADLSRKSVALYFYTKDRPPEEVAGKHTTHYVNRQLPDHFVGGYTLKLADVEMLGELIGHRDRQLRQLYAENTNLLQAQERGFGGQILYLLKRLYVRYRR
ncbi:MAG TPA: 2OG-Fe(II) oxygenase [Rudaea sp.]